VTKMISYLRIGNLKNHVLSRGNTYIANKWESPHGEEDCLAWRLRDEPRELPQASQRAFALEAVFVAREHTGKSFNGEKIPFARKLKDEMETKTMRCLK